MPEGNYIADTDIDNWPATATESDKTAVIRRVEERIEKLTKDFFRPKNFDIKLDGNGANRLNLQLMPNILSISAVEISGVALSTSYYTYDKSSIFISTGIATTEAELRYLLRRTESTSLFPRGFANIRVIGSYGWTERLDVDNISGVFEVGEVITGGTSGATATIQMVESDYLKIAGRSSTNFSNDEEITGGTSGETADVNSASGAVNDPPEGIKEACIILARYANNDSLYTVYLQGSENFGGVSYSTKDKPLTGLREADILIRPYVRRKPRIGVV